MNKVYLGLGLGFLGGCFGHSPKDSKEVRPSRDRDSGGPAQVDMSEGDLRTFTYSQNNYGVNLRSYDKRKIAEAQDKLGEKVKNPKFEDRKDLLALMAAKRFAGASYAEILALAQKLAQVELKKDIKRELSEAARLEIVLSSIRNKRWPMALHFIDELKDSRNPTIKAAVINAEGYIALADGRLPEAVALWGDALKVLPTYEPAALNVGITAMKYGDINTARKVLARVPGDFLVQSTLLVGDRLSGQGSKVEDTCNNLLGKNKKYRPLLLNCALNRAQALGQPDQAEQHLREFIKLKTDVTEYDERAERIMLKLEDEKRHKAEKAIKQKAAEKTEKVEKSEKPEPAETKTPKSDAPPAPKS